MAGHTFTQHLLQDTRTLVFQRVDPDQASTLDKTFQSVNREPKSIVIANIAVGQIAVTIEWERIDPAQTIIIANEYPIAASDSRQADMTPYQIRPGDKIYVTCTGLAECFVHAEALEEKS